ncbi:tetratricopeptide repeat protein [Candidatus Woesearchaeota archaeon]|nr:tetratricopeptide repeat protein [Candidatus Woesearchaeota archaeon]
MVLDISTYPTLDDISRLVINPDRFDPKAFSQVASAFGTEEMENPFGATEEMVGHVKYIRDMNTDVQKLEALIDLFSSEDTIERQVEIEVPSALNFIRNSKPKKKVIIEKTRPVRMYYDTNKIEARNARELFEYAMKNREVPAVCLENTLLWLAFGNAVGLKVGAYEIPTREITINGEKKGNVEEHRNHIVPVVFIKGKEKYHAIKIETPIKGNRAELVQQFTNYRSHSCHTLVLAYMNNYKVSLQEKALTLIKRTKTINEMLRMNVDANNLLLRNQAIQLYFDEKYNEALPLLERLQREHEKKHGKNKGSHAEALMYKGKTLFKLGRYDEAIEAFKEFLPTDFSDKFWEFQRYHMTPSFDYEADFSGYRGIRDSSAIAQMMVMWGSSLEDKLPEGQKLSAEEQQLKDKLYRYAIEFGFRNTDLMQEILSQDMDNTSKSNTGRSLYNSEELQRHYVLLLHWLVEDYQQAKASDNPEGLNQAREDIFNFMFTTMNFYVDYDKFLTAFPSKFMTTKKLLKMIISNPKMKERVESHGKVIEIIGTEQYHKMLSDKPWDFDIKDVVENTPYPLSRDLSKYDSTRRLVGLNDS